MTTPGCNVQGEQMQGSITRATSFRGPADRRLRVASTTWVTHIRSKPARRDAIVPPLLSVAHANAANHAGLLSVGMSDEQTAAVDIDGGASHVGVEQECHDLSGNMFRQSDDADG
jgi:hypothetical protein